MPTMPSYQLLQYPNSLTNMKAMVQQRIEEADQCGCTDCTVDSLVYQWFLLIAAEKEGEQQEQKDKTHAQGL